MGEASKTPRTGSLLPKDWWRAPRIWWDQEPHAFFIFALVNFGFGTLGLWLPLLNAWLGGRTPIHEELYKLFSTGGFYMYSVPFLAATVGVVFTSMMQESAEQSRGTKLLFSFVAIIIFVVCAVLLQIQLLGPAKSVEWINFTLQFLVSLITIVAALYVHALIQNERGSPQDDMERNAADLTSRAQTAAATPADFA
jgi:cytochrome bd-type quinol oxidase subunit 2